MMMLRFGFCFVLCFSLIMLKYENMQVLVLECNNSVARVIKHVPMTVLQVSSSW